MYIHTYVHTGKCIHTVPFLSSGDLSSWQEECLSWETCTPSLYTECWRHLHQGCRGSSGSPRTGPEGYRDHNELRMYVCMYITLTDTQCQWPPAMYCTCRSIVYVQYTHTGLSNCGDSQRTFNRCDFQKAHTLIPTEGWGSNGLTHYGNATWLQLLQWWRLTSLSHTTPSLSASCPYQWNGMDAHICSGQCRLHGHRQARQPCRMTKEYVEACGTQP